MEKEHYYHMFANGDDAKNFITDESEFKAACNRFALCQYLTGAVVLSLSVEDAHPHALLWGNYECCRKFADLYVDFSIRSVVQKRGSTEGMNLFCEILQIDDEQYLKNVGTYTVTQATKDGKAVMPYDYLYGTGALYFRCHNAILPWLIDDSGHQMEPVRMGILPAVIRQEDYSSFDNNRENRSIPTSAQAVSHFLSSTFFACRDSGIRTSEIRQVSPTVRLGTECRRIKKRSPSRRPF